MTPPVATATHHVLLVEDEAKTRESIAEGLRIEGWTVTTAAGGQEAIRQLGSGAFDLIVLDWLLPDFDGIEVLRRLRGRGLATPVLMLTARDTLHDRLTGLDTGADDYLGKPFAFAELLARARALLRRPSWSDGRLLQFGDLRLDTRTRIAIRNGQEIPLTPREVDLLEYLLRYQGETVTREMLARDVWKETHRCTSLDNVIDVQLTRLRRKVDPDENSRLIQTVRGVGYRLGGGGD
jgi:two-component system copper resistance phosphate regulon response regulator CusR